jgi:diacylglycerol kinase (ATP)
MEAPEEKKTGLAHLFAAASYSLAGFRRALGESAFRHEIIMFVAGLVLFAIVGATLAEYLILVILFMILFGFEALNTAVEELVDRVSPEVSNTGKHAKDLGSFAVFCMLVSVGLYMAWVVFL